MKTIITALYRAKLRIAYTKGYSEERRRLVFKAIHETATSHDLLDDERFTNWMGGTDWITVNFAAHDKNAIEMAVWTLENYLKNSTIVKLADPV